MPAATVEYKQGMDYGVGIDTPSGDARNACVEGAPTDIGNATGDTVTFEMTEVTSIEDIQSALGISASASAGVGLFSASAKMNYAESCHFHSNSVFLMVSINVLQAFNSIKAPAISATAASLLTQGNTGRFQDMYGDMFVRGLVTGGQFFGVIEVSTTDTTDQRNLSVQLSGSYGLFNASGSVSTSFTSAIQNRSVKVSCFIQGGQTSPIPTTVEDMVIAAKTWPGTLAGKGVPYSALLDSYSILDLPNPPNYIDLQHQKDVLLECAQLRNQDWFLINEIDFIVAHSEQFILPVDLIALGTYRNQLAADLNSIAAAASTALNAPKSAQFPALTATPVPLPKRIDGQPLTPSTPPEIVTVPNLIGLVAADAESAAADFRLNEVRGEGRTGWEGAAGVVYQQDPSAGTPALKGSVLTVTEYDDAN